MLALGRVSYFTTKNLGVYKSVNGNSERCVVDAQDLAFTIDRILRIQSNHFFGQLIYIYIYTSCFNHPQLVFAHYPSIWYSGPKKCIVSFKPITGLEMCQNNWLYFSNGITFGRAIVPTFFLGKIHSLKLTVCLYK